MQRQKMTKNNLGKKFEEVVRKSFEQVPNVSVDRLRDAPKKLKNVDNPADFIVYKKPHEIYVECKSHKGNTLPFSCIRQEQLDGMTEKWLKEGVIAGFMIWFIDHDLTVWVSIDMIKTMIWFDKKSLNILDLDKIPHLVVPGRKKRVYFDYDMKQFLEDLYGNRRT